MRDRKEPEIDPRRAAAGGPRGRGGSLLGRLFRSRPETSSHAAWLEYHGRAGGLFAICLTNLLLMIPTLGLYWFWGRTRLRRYVWSNTTLQGEAFDHTGSGGALLRGFLLMALVVLVPIAAATLVVRSAFPVDPMLQYGFAAAVSALVAFLVPVARYLRLRYLITHTEWRGIRGRLRGWALAFGLRSILFGVVALVSLGLAIPSMTVRLVSYGLNHVDIGDRRLRFRAGNLTWLYLAHLCRVLPLLIVGGVIAARIWGGSLPDVEPTGGIDWMGMPGGQALDRLAIETVVILGIAGIAVLLANAWYHTLLYRMMAHNATITGLACHYSGTTAGLAGLWVINALIVAIPCGLVGGGAVLLALELDLLHHALVPMAAPMADPAIAMLWSIRLIVAAVAAVIALVTTLVTPLLWHRTITYMIGNLQIVTSDRLEALGQSHGGRGGGEGLSDAVGTADLFA